MTDEIATERAIQDTFSEGERRSQLAVYKGTPIPMVIPDDWLNGRADGQFVSTINRDRPEGRKLIMRALNGDSKELSEVVNIQITIAGVTLSPASKFDDETGAMTYFVRTILHCHDGKMYHASSDGVLKSLRILESLYGPQMFDPPKKCTPKRVSTSGNRSMYRLDWED